MTREKSIDMFIIMMNVVAIMVLVGILSAMVNAAEAGQLDSEATSPPDVEATILAPD